MQMTQPTVTIYKLHTSTGRPIRTATKVTFADGTEVLFMERMTKREAIAQAVKSR